MKIKIYLCFIAVAAATFISGVGFFAIRTLFSVGFVSAEVSNNRIANFGEQINHR